MRQSLAQMIIRKNNVLSANEWSSKLQTAVSLAFSYLRQCRIQCNRQSPVPVQNPVQSSVQNFCTDEGSWMLPKLQFAIYLTVHWRSKRCFSLFSFNHSFLRRKHCYFIPNTAAEILPNVLIIDIFDSTMSGKILGIILAIHYFNLVN